MDRECAELIMRHVGAIDLLLGHTADVLDHYADSAKLAEIRSGIFKVVDAVHLNIARPITDVFPDLDPDA